MGVLPGVLGCRPLRRTVQVRLGRIPRYRGTVARWHAHLSGLATAIHELSGLVDVRLFPLIWDGKTCSISRKVAGWCQLLFRMMRPERF
ncbi:MAG: hypothetical protein OES18_24940 [Deltaproteobacteria bacterium]|nr:hypothetical protein [Deltaproteobacteria bacterium]